MNSSPSQDAEHLKLLSIFHYVVAGITGFFALIPVIHLVMGLVMVFAPDKFGHGGNAPPAFVGWLVVAFATGFILLGLTLATLILVSGRALTKRKRYVFCQVVAGIECICFPFGTALGVFTLIVLMRPSVKAMFGNNSG